jgi:hypothetical protein
MKCGLSSGTVRDEEPSHDLRLAMLEYGATCRPNVTNLNGLDGNTFGGGLFGGLFRCHLSGLDDPCNHREKGGDCGFHSFSQHIVIHSLLFKLVAPQYPITEVDQDMTQDRKEPLERSPKHVGST